MMKNKPSSREWAIENSQQILESAAHFAALYIEAGDVESAIDHIGLAELALRWKKEKKQQQESE